MNILHQIGTGLAACTGILMIIFGGLSLILGLQYLFNIVKDWVNK